MGKKISISTPPDFNFLECLRFLQRSNLEVLFQVNLDKVELALEVGNDIFLIQISWKKNKLEMEILEGDLTPKSKKYIVAYVVEWLDINRDLKDFEAICENDQLLKGIWQENKGLRLIGIPNFLEAISWAIIGQQINLTFAYTLKKRLVENFGRKISFDNNDFFLFPSASVMANLTEDDLRPLQFSRSKIKYLTTLANAIHLQDISKAKLSQLSYDDAKKQLIAYKGIGNWTADYVLMKCLRMPNAFPITDVGIHNAIKAALKLKEKPSLERVEAMSKNWENWKAYATFYLWHSLLKI